MELRLSKHCAGNEPAAPGNSLTCRPTVHTSEHTTVPVIAVTASQNDASTSGCSANYQRNRARSPLLVWQGAAPCEPATSAAILTITDPAAHVHCEHNALTTIFERATILSNNCGIVAHTQQPLSRRRGGTKAHQRTTISVGSHAFENFSAQALACEGPSLISRSDPTTASTRACARPTGAIETCTLADQVISTNTC